MLSGRTPADYFAHGAPRLERLDADEVRLEGVKIFQLLCETAAENVCDLLPPALHPTNPPVVSWLVYDCAMSPWGPMRLAQTRIECRSGTRPRALLVSAACDNARACEALASGWGFRARLGSVAFAHRYDEVRIEVTSDLPDGGGGGRRILAIGMAAPTLLEPGNVQFVANMHPAETPRGFRLVQCETHHEVLRAERGKPSAVAFDAAAWGEPRLDPTTPISASLCEGAVVLPRLRFLCRPDELAFTGTEAV